MFEVNVHGALFYSQQAIQAMRRSDGAVSLILRLVEEFILAVRRTAYCSTQAALVSDGGLIANGLQLMGEADV